MQSHDIVVKSWGEFRAVVLQQIFAHSEEPATGRPINAPLFRGHGSSDWNLTTTLERSFPLERCSSEAMSLSQYYRIARASVPIVATLTGRRWEKLPDVTDFDRLLRENHGSLALDMLLNQTVSVYEYFVYLRHHGFPSPLLDWTASPYVAAFFAFDAMPPSATNVCIYALSQDSMHSWGSDGHLFVVGPYVQSHARHFAQQSQYTLCVSLRKFDYEFLRHDGDPLRDALGPGGALRRIIVPASERTSALKDLDLMNINPYSVYGSEDALIRTIARRECLFRSLRTDMPL